MIYRLYRTPYLCKPDNSLYIPPELLLILPRSL